MYILGIETTGAFASVALMKDDRIIGHVQGNDRFSHLQNLMPQVQTVVKECELSLGDMDAIAVSRGPGSFTGIRIGISSARALSQITGVPCIPVSSLEALAMRAADHAKGDVLVCPMLDARRSQVYAGGYFLKDGLAEEVIEAGPYMLDEFLSKAEGYDRILVLGDAVDTYGEKIAEIRSEGVETAPEEIRYQDASTVVKLGAVKFEAEGGLAYNDVEPDYMRLAEAERKLKEQQGRG